MEYQNISPSYRPMDERKPMPKAQVLLMRWVAMIILMVLVVLSYTGYSQGIEQDGPALNGTAITPSLTEEIQLP